MIHLYRENTSLRNESRALLRSYQEREEEERKLRQERERREEEALWQRRQLRPEGPA